MQYDFFSHAFLFLSIVFTLVLYYYSSKLYLFGIFFIALSLSFLDLPDINEYRDHYEFSGQFGYEFVSRFTNFERGYVLTNTLLSPYISFKFFYIIIISLTIYAYLKFFEISDKDNSYIYATVFFSLCLYFVAFTLRTTISSIFLAFALICIRNKRYIGSLILISIGSLFHILILILLILPFISIFSKLISKYIFILLPAVGMAAFIVGQNFDLAELAGFNRVLDLKVNAYTEANLSSNSVFLVMWLIAFCGTFISFKRLDDFDRALIITLLAALAFLVPFQFIQGRFMWLTSFLFAYILSKGTFNRLKLSETGAMVFMAVLPLAVFFRI